MLFLNFKNPNKKVHDNFSQSITVDLKLLKKFKSALGHLPEYLKKELKKDDNRR
jgi:hypothetical protein